MLKLLVVPLLVRQAALLPLPLRRPPLQVVQGLARVRLVPPLVVLAQQRLPLVWPFRELGQLAYRLLASVSAWRVSLGL
ncbi:hypothetical protein [Celeribacter halophilus]|uniref:hypothetical protein n=1 Tax=Celeribacter halophilus TaxID=576117 RepID=UPI001C08CE93|nr:hypothetical protein [Celeribacter halophilus]MBU2888856.1 hypothetical protein [Celeribacter halophilus]MDO6511974.1 hypothetical protein [Celeribacter halophilus]